MIKLQFVWDNRKADSNLKKHGVSFQEAISVFTDDNAVEFFDETHSSAEERFLMLGISHKLRLLLVAFCYKEDVSTVRIISARKATKNECLHYPYRR